eukprot:3492080-Alexandrium_andersonii.AAC.1
MAQPRRQREPPPHGPGRSAGPYAASPGAPGVRGQAVPVAAGERGVLPARASGLGELAAGALYGRAVGPARGGQCGRAHVP